MFTSGWGDGYYPVYFAYDAQGNVCAVYILFIQTLPTSTMTRCHTSIAISNFINKEASHEHTYVGSLGGSFIT